MAKEGKTGQKIDLHLSFFENYFLGRRVAGGGGFLSARSFRLGLVEGGRCPALPASTGWMDGWMDGWMSYLARQTMRKYMDIILT